MKNNTFSAPKLTSTLAMCFLTLQISLAQTIQGGLPRAGSKSMSSEVGQLFSDIKKPSTTDPSRPQPPAIMLTTSLGDPDTISLSRINFHSPSILDVDTCATNFYNAHTKLCEVTLPLFIRLLRNGGIDIQEDSIHNLKFANDSIYYKQYNLFDLPAQHPDSVSVVFSDTEITQVMNALHNYGIWRVAFDKALGRAYQSKKIDIEQYEQLTGYKANYTPLAENISVWQKLIRFELYSRGRIPYKAYDTNTFLYWCDKFILEEIEQYKLEFRTSQSQQD